MKAACTDDRQQAGTARRGLVSRPLPTRGDDAVGQRPGPGLSGRCSA